MLIRLFEQQGAHMLQVTCVSLIGGEKLTLHKFTSVTSTQRLDILGSGTSHDTHDKVRGSLMSIVTCNIEAVCNLEQGRTQSRSKFQQHLPSRINSPADV